jgi:general secretion pathway protein C
MKHLSVCFFLKSTLFFFCVTAFFGFSISVVQAEEDLGLILVGTAVTDEPGESFAIIEVQSTGRQGTFHEGERWREILIKKIQPGYAVIDTGKGENILYMGSGTSTGSAALSGEAAQLDKREVDSTLPDQSQLMREISVRPRFEGGQPVGFVIYGIGTGSIFERMGLRDGDIIEGMNGKSFATAQQTVEFYDALKQGGTVSLDVRRGESKHGLRFVIQ